MRTRPYFQLVLQSLMWTGLFIYFFLSNSKCHLTQPCYWLHWFLTKDRDVVTKNSEHRFTTRSRLLNKTQIFSSSCESRRLDLCFILTEASSCLFSFIQLAGRPLGLQVSSSLQLLPWIRSRVRVKTSPPESQHKFNKNIQLSNDSSGQRGF